MSRDNLYVVMIFLTYDSGVEGYLNLTNYKKILGMYLHAAVGSTAHLLYTTSHYRALNQSTIITESFVSQHFSSKRMDE